MTREEVKAIGDVVDSGMIVFRAANPKRQKSVVTTPLNDRTGQLYTGQGALGYYETLTPKEKESIGFVFDHKSKYVVEDGKVLYIGTNPHHAAIWKWVALHPYIAATKEDCERERGDAVYYVDNPKKQADEFVSRDKKLVKVKTDIYNASSEQMINVSKALGLTGAEGLSPIEIEKWLVIRAESSPDEVSVLLRPDKSSYVTALGMLTEMVNYGIVKQFGGTYMYGGKEGISLGHSEEQAAMWIADSKNEDTFIAMKFALDEKKGLV